MVIVLYFLPIIVVADGLVPCNGVDCKYDHLIELVNKIITFLLTGVAIPLAAVMFAYAGFLMFTSGGVEGKLTQAKQLMWGVLWGMIIAFGAWVIIQTVLTALGFDKGWSLLG